MNHILLIVHVIRAGNASDEAIDRVEGTTIPLPKNAAHCPDPALIRRRYADKR